jgi:hypothetical protein
MKKSKLIVTLGLATFAAATMLIPLQSNASGVRSLGHGIKCAWHYSYTSPTLGDVYVYTCNQGL